MKVVRKDQMDIEIDQLANAPCPSCQQVECIEVLEIGKFWVAPSCRFTCRECHLCWGEILLTGGFWREDPIDAPA